MNANPNESPASPHVPDPVLDCLLFMARYFGKPIEADTIVGGVPLPDGRITPAEIDECAARAGLSATRYVGAAKSIRASLLPALLVTANGDALIVLQRFGDRTECRMAGVGGVAWVSFGDLLADHADGVWFLLRPRFEFDRRSLLYHLPEPRRWFWGTLRNNRWIYAWALLGTVALNLFGAVTPFYTMAVYDRVVPNNALDSLWVLTIAVVVVTVFELLLRVLRGYLLESAARKVDVALSTHIFAHALRLRPSSRPASGGVLANVVRDFESVREFFTSATLTMLGDLPFMFFFLAVIGLIGGSLVLVPALIGVAAILSSLLLQRPLAKVLGQNMEESAQRTAHLFEVMNGLDTVKSMGADAWARRKWEMLTVRLSENGLRMREISSFGSYWSATLTGLDTVLIILFGAMMIADEQLTMGQLVAVSMLASRAIAPISQIAGLIVRWQQTKLALNALDQVMAAATDESPSGLHVSALRGQVEMRDVYFSYAHGAPLLRGVNLRIRPGEKVGFIGRVGSGKSTLLRLLVNLYVPDEGQVMVDGVSVSQMDPLSLRRLIGYVPQDVVLFHGNVRDNILLGCTEVDDEALMRAIRLACLEETLNQLPEGVGTEVGERGDRLSGGQRQSVAIARALVRKPNLLLLDEPSSMMDPGTEARFIANLKTLKDTTIMLVTHRMAMLPLVDRLIVIDQGRVLVDGPRDEVLRRLKMAKKATAGEKMEVAV